VRTTPDAEDRDESKQAQEARDRDPRSAGIKKPQQQESRGERRGQHPAEGWVRIYPPPGAVALQQLDILNPYATGAAGLR